MERIKLFVSNFLIYGLGGVISKIIPFIMLPILTRLMPSPIYLGLNDISTIIVAFASALSIMGMYDAMFRMFFEKDSIEYKRSICSTTLAFTCCTSISVFFILLVFRNFFSILCFGNKKYSYLLMLSAGSALCGATNSIMAAPTRINNQRKTYLVLNILTPIISYSISIPLLLNGYYIIGLPLASLISAVTMEILFLVLNRKWFKVKYINFKNIKFMLKIAIPLLPNFLIYWVFNSSDKLMIGSMLGNDMVGIYAVGGKIGSISQLIYLAFVGGWQYFAFSTMKDDDQIKMTSNILEYMAIITLITSIIIIMFGDFFFKMLFTKEYWRGSVVVPYLYMSPLLLMLYQIACNQFLIVKKTWPNFLILSVGAILNIGLNFILIPKIGIEGAGVATLIGYVISVVICIIILKKAQLLEVSVRFKVIIVVFSIYFILWRILLKHYFILSISCGGIIFVCIISAYWKVIIQFYKKTKRIV